MPVLAGKLRVALQEALQLLQDVTRTGPLMALLTASMLREDFIRVNRDLMNTFHLLAAGEQLLVRLMMVVTSIVSKIRGKYLDCTAKSSESLVSKAQARKHTYH